jgi:hypothetical protein
MLLTAGERISMALLSMAIILASLATQGRPPGRPGGPAVIAVG